MATAKRVAQTGKYERTETPYCIQTFNVVVRDGKEVGRTKVGSDATGFVLGHRFVPLPDRIVLDLSLEEAQTLLSYDFLTSRVVSVERSRVIDIAQALTRALSSAQGTPASPAAVVDNKCGPDPRYQEPTYR